MDNNFEEKGSSAFAEENSSEQQNMNSTPYPQEYPKDGQEQLYPRDAENTESKTVSWQQISNTPYPQQEQQPYTQTNSQGQPYPDPTINPNINASQPYSANVQNSMSTGQPCSDPTVNPNINVNQPYSANVQNSMPNGQPRYDMPTMGYMPPNMPNMPNGMGGNMYPPPAEKKKRAFKGGCFWTLVVTIFLTFVVILLFAASISMKDSKPNIIDDILKNEDAHTQKTQIQHTEVILPRSERPVLEEEMYQNSETGLLTTVGVAKMILPSQVKVKVFDEMPYLPVSSGSGIILTEDGYILTNAHVVDGAKRLAVILYDGTEKEAEIVGIDKKSDLAVISINAEGLTPAEMGTSSNLVIGEEVALAGAGGGFENTVTYGHITGLAREIDTDYMSSSTIQCIQSDAALNPGNSGGALVNMYGQVVGVPVALMNHETYENIGFSIAVDDAVPIAEELIAYGYVTSRTRVGITYASIGDAPANGYGIMSGLCVMSVDPTSGAAQAGLEPYDIITAMDGVRTFGAEEIAEVLKDKRPGDTITLTVFRKSVTDEIEIFDTTIVLSPDTSSISGYSVNGNESSFFERDIIR